MLIYPESLVSRTHGLRLPKDGGNEASWDAPRGDLNPPASCVCQACREDSLTPVLCGVPVPSHRAPPGHPLKHLDLLT